MTPPRGRFGALRSRARWPLTALLGVAACVGGGVDASHMDERPANIPERAIRPTAWDTVFHAGGDLQDTLFQAPAALAADEQGVFVLDRHAGTVLRYVPSGRLLWSWGGRGAGPDELQEPRSMHLDGSGRVWVSDVENGRLVVLSPEGRVDRSIRLDRVGHHAHAFVPVDDGGAILMVLDSEAPFVRLDAAGELVERRGFPWPGFGRLNPLASQLIAARDRASSHWAVAFAVGDGFFGFDDSNWLGYRGWFVEPVDFPQARVQRRWTVGRTVEHTSLQETVFAATSLAFDADRLLVLFAGRSDDASRVVDVYRLEDGAYQESFLLPVRASRLAYADSLYYVLAANPYPELLALRRR